MIIRIDESEIVSGDLRKAVISCIRDTVCGKQEQFYPRIGRGIFFTYLLGPVRSVSADDDELDIAVSLVEHAFYTLFEVSFYVINYHYDAYHRLPFLSLQDTHTRATRQAL